jgi:NDP-sugar pyrophosphorylase family protein
MSERLPPVAILAGGKGTRLGADGRPKPLVEVAGRPFVLHQLELLSAHGAGEIVLCVGYLGEQIEAAVGDGGALGLSVSYSYDPPRLAGTAGAIRGALPALRDEFMVLYGDTYLRIDYRGVAAARRESGLPALLTVFHNRGQLDRSNTEYADGIVRAHDKQHPTAAMEWIDYGLAAFTRAGFEAGGGLGADDLSDVYRSLAQARKLAGYEATHRFYEIGSPAALAETDAFLRERRGR